mmetsp:Transcript_39115/g.79762  ORF Transcript_39115/g.79762 Transcript_39115/m.79762 type:complete len:309 (-) Transcript_39115:7-933(-)
MTSGQILKLKEVVVPGWRDNDVFVTTKYGSSPDDTDTHGASSPPSVSLAPFTGEIRTKSGTQKSSDELLNLQRFWLGFTLSKSSVITMACSLVHLRPLWGHSFPPAFRFATSCTSPSRMGTPRGFESSKVTVRGSMRARTGGLDTARPDLALCRARKAASAFSLSTSVITRRMCSSSVTGAEEVPSASLAAAEAAAAARNSACTRHIISSQTAFDPSPATPKPGTSPSVFPMDAPSPLTSTKEEGPMLLLPLSSPITPEMESIRLNVTALASFSTLRRLTVSSCTLGRSMFGISKRRAHPGVTLRTSS